MKRKNEQDWIILERVGGCYVLRAASNQTRNQSANEIILKEFEADGGLNAAKEFQQWIKENKCQNKRDI